MPYLHVFAHISVSVQNRLLLGDQPYTYLSFRSAQALQFAVTLPWYLPCPILRLNKCSLTYSPFAQHAMSTVTLWGVQLWPKTCAWPFWPIHWQVQRLSLADLIREHFFPCIILGEQPVHGSVWGHYSEGLRPLSDHVPIRICIPHLGASVQSPLYLGSDLPSMQIFRHLSLWPKII